MALNSKNTIKANKSTGLFAYLTLNLGLDDENAQKIFEIAGVLLIAEFSNLNITTKEAGLLLDSSIGLNIAAYTAYNFVEGLRPEVFSEKLSIVIPLFRDQITDLIYMLRSKVS